MNNQIIYLDLKRNATRRDWYLKVSSTITSRKRVGKGTHIYIWGQLPKNKTIIKDSTKFQAWRGYWENNPDGTAKEYRDLFD